MVGVAFHEGDVPAFRLAVIFSILELFFVNSIPLHPDVSFFLHFGQRKWWLLFFTFPC